MDVGLSRYLENDNVQCDGAPGLVHFDGEYWRSCRSVLEAVDHYRARNRDLLVDGLASPAIKYRVQMQSTSSAYVHGRMLVTPKILNFKLHSS